MTALNDGRDKDPEGDAADVGQLKTPTCAYCGGPLDTDGLCVDKWCPNSGDDLDEEDLDELDDEYPQGLLGEGDDDA